MGDMVSMAHTVGTVVTVGMMETKATPAMVRKCKIPLSDNECLAGASTYSLPSAQPRKCLRQSQTAYRGPALDPSRLSGSSQGLPSKRRKAERARKYCFP